MKKPYFFGILAIFIVLLAFPFATNFVSAQYYNYNNCTYHAYKLCSGNNVYWYDSCGSQQDLFQSCYGTNMVCKYGQCVYQQPYIPPVKPYITHYKTGCYADNLYWYDSLGSATGLYKNCADSNSCTLDSCVSGKCSNTIKCDGSTCASDSADYNNYCSTNNNSNNGNTNTNGNTNVNNLSITFFTKQDPNSNQWQKTIQANANSQVYFMISVANNSTSTINNINVSANIPSEISLLGNLQANGVPLSGDIVSGINIGSLATSTAKAITFEGKIQAISAKATKQAIATGNVSGVVQTDSVSINFNQGQASIAAVSSSQATSGFWAFLKRWYLWILVGLVLIFLFIVIFRRLSSNT